MAHDFRMSLAFLGLALSLAGAQALTMEMQVEEPSLISAPPIDPDHEAGTWNNKKASSALNRSEKAAYEERRRKVEEMASIIRAKRDAVENSGHDDRAARVKDLEDLILDGVGATESDAQKLKQMEKLVEKRTQAREKNLERKLEQLDKKLEKELEKKLEKLEKDLPKDKEGKSRQQKSGK